MPKLNPNAQKWVDALRSGKYRQGQEALRKNDHELDPAYCCLGVGCEVARLSGIEVIPNGRGGYDQEDSYLPEIVKDWLGLKTARGHYVQPDESDPDFVRDKNSLVELNDLAGLSLEQIADFIEEHAEELGVAAHA